MPKVTTKKSPAKSSKPKAVKASTTPVEEKTTESSAASRLSAKERAQKATTWLMPRLKEPKVFVPLIALIIIILLVVFRSSFIVAVVNGQPISRAEFNRQLEVQAGKQVMNSLVTEKLVEQQAAKQNITVSQSELDAQIKVIQQQLASQGQTLDSALAAQGLTQSDFVTQLRLQTLVKKMLGSKISVTDKEISDYMTQNKASLPTGETDAQLKAQVKQQLEQQKLSQQAQALVQKLQQQAKINYFINL